MVLTAGGHTDQFSWKRLEPADLWTDDGPLARIHAPWPEYEDRDVGVTAALFSWGEATFYALNR